MTASDRTGASTVVSEATSPRFPLTGWSRGLVPRLPRIAPWPAWSRSSRVGAAVLLLVVVGIAGFLATGWRLFVVESPSMGTVAPVGTLVVDRPVAAGGVRIGDVITYRSPDASGHTFTHRVVAMRSAGLTARGDINGAADPWTIPKRNVVGVVALLVPGVGWLLRLGPPIALGASVLWVLCGLVPSATWRAGARLFGLSVVVSAVISYFRPLANSVVLTSVPAGEHVRASVVGTGFLPVRLESPGGAVLDLAAGEVGRLSFPATAEGRYTFTTALHLDPGSWAVLVLLWLLPLLVVVVVGLPTDAAAQSEVASDVVG